MKPAPFRYHAPRTLDEALEVMSEHGEAAAPLAGGQSLLPSMNMRVARPAHVVDLNRITGFDRKDITDEEIHVGALVRHNAFGASSPGDPTEALLAEIEPYVGHPPIRARGTFVGSVALNAPAAEWCVATALLDGHVVLVGRDGKRFVKAGDFWVAPFTTARAPHEILTEVRLHKLAPDHRVAFVEQARTVADFPLVCAAAAARVVEGRLREVKVAIGGVAGTAVNLHRMEDALEGASHDDEAAIREAASEALSLGSHDEPYGSGDYKRHLGMVLAARALTTAVGRA